MVQEIITELSDFIASQEQYFKDSELIPFAHFEPFDEQYLPDVEGNVMILPCPFILFEFDLDFIEDGSLSQQVTGLLRLHIGQESYAYAERNSEDYDLAMRTVRHVEATNVLLHGLSGESFGKLMRRKWYLAKGSKINKVDIVEYAFTSTDDTTNRFKNYVGNGGDGALNIAPQLVQKIAQPDEPVAPKYRL